MKDISGIRQGDETTFREVYEQYHSRVFRYFLKRTSSPEMAGELTQQLFVRLWQFRHTLSETHHLEAQLFTMSNHVWIDHLRKEATARKYYSPLPETGQVPETWADPSSHHQAETNDFLKQAIHRLPPVRRKIFILKILHGFSNQEIAGKLSVSVKTVEDHLWKATRYIRSIIPTIWGIFFMLQVPGLPY